MIRQLSIYVTFIARMPRSNCYQFIACLKWDFKLSKCSAIFFFFLVKVQMLCLLDEKYFYLIKKNIVILDCLDIKMLLFSLFLPSICMAISKHVNACYKIIKKKVKNIIKSQDFTSLSDSIPNLYFFIFCRVNQFSDLY